MSQVTEMFGKARDLPPEERQAFLAETCGDQTELREEIESLLAYHRPDTLTDVTGIRGQPRRLAWATARGRRRIALVSLIAGVACAVAGFFVSGLVRRELRADLQSRLQASLSTSVSTYQDRVESWRSDLVRWAGHPEVRAELRDLTRVLQGRDATAREIQTLGPHKKLERILAPLTSRDDITYVHATSRENVIVFFGEEDFGDQVFRLNAAGGRLILPIFSGGSIISAPHSAGANVGVGQPRPVAQIIAAAPVHDDDGEIIAALLIRTGEPDIARFLQDEQLGPGGDTFAINREGVLVSRSRHEDDLVSVGLLPSGASSVLRISARDPGGDLISGFQPADPPAAWPPTKMAILATAGEPGLDLDGYRDLRGKTVVGAWEWLPEYNIGIATEIEAREAYALAGTLRMAFGALVALLIGVAGYGFLSTLSIDRWRQRILEAERLGQYRLEEPIGAGGMATVYRAHHTMLERPVAIKLIRVGEVAPEALARFKREARLVSRLHHPNTIQVFDYGQTPEGSPFFVMELVSGISLAELVRTGGALPSERAVFILRQICESLRDAHRRGIVHRDIKPANVMLSDRPEEPDLAKVLDFGLARTVSLESTQITQQQLLGGTPAYIAPERVRNPERVDPSSDVYAVGAVAFYLLTGHQLIEGASPEEILLKTIEGAQARPSSLATSAIPRALDELVFECLARDPDERPEDMDAILEVLADLAHASSWSEDQARDWLARYRAPSDPPDRGEPAAV
jgi:RIO-like serine/threonine protein kinase